VYSSVYSGKLKKNLAHKSNRFTAFNYKNTLFYSAAPSSDR